MNLEVVGHRVLIRPHYQEEYTEGGIYLATGNDFKRELGATQVGEIVGVGPNAWLAFDDGKPWAKVGDIVYYAKYSGKEIEAGEDEKYVIVNDEDVQCIIKQEEVDSE